MARIFTIRFSFDHADHTALVTERHTPFATEYNLSMLDPEVEESLPDNRVLSSQTGTLAFLKNNGAQTPLMRSILNAIADHVRSVA